MAILAASEARDVHQRLLAIRDAREDITPHMLDAVSGKLNKGGRGTAVERMLLIANNNSPLPDTPEGEIKTHKLVYNKNGELTVRESIALGMVNLGALRAYADTDGTVTPFRSSHLYAKVQRAFYCGIVTEPMGVYMHTVHLVDFDDSRYITFLNDVEQDWHSIVTTAASGASLHGRGYKYLQTRTKGTGHGSISRGFYWRAAAVRELMRLASLG